MSRVTIQGLVKKFSGKPPTIAADDLTLEIAEGEFLVLLGPSGCGKTTTLRCLAGLEVPDAGRIAFGETRVFDSEAGIDVAPDKRNIGMVFQSYALWPHMTVRQNIEFPLRVRKIRQGLAAGWVEEMVRLVDCETLLDRYPAQLSGGQQQRVALARGLVSRPDLVLFDEPLSNLDAKLREQVRGQLHELHARLGFTAVFVTHDQAEALALADRLAIMRRGRIEQLDSPHAVFARPVSEYVADFIGMGNCFPLRRDGVDWLCGEQVLRGGVETGGSVDALRVRVRSEDVHVAAPGFEPPPRCLSVPARVIDAAFGGRHFDVAVTVGGVRVQARAEIGGDTAGAELEAGSEVSVWFESGHAAVFAGDGGRIDLSGAAGSPR